MFKKTVVMCILVFFAVSLINLQTTNSSDKVKLPDGTLVILKVKDTLRCRDLGVGDIVKLEVADDVKINEKVVIKKGTKAIAEVVSSEKEGMIGKGGKVSLSLRSTTATDGQKVPLRGSLHREGESKMGTSIVVSAVICPLALLMKGESAEIPAGSEMKGFVDTNMEISI